MQYFDITLPHLSIRLPLPLLSFVGLVTMCGFMCSILLPIQLALDQIWSQQCRTLCMCKICGYSMLNGYPLPFVRQPASCVTKCRLILDFSMLRRVKEMNDKLM